MCRLFTLVLGFTFFVFAAATTARAADPGPSIHIQLQAFQAPLANSKHKVFVTVFLMVPQQNQLWQVCKSRLKVRDSILASLYQHPVGRTKNGRLDLATLSTQLLGPVNASLAEPHVGEVVAVAGDIPHDHGPIAKPPIPNPKNCGNIGFREKRIK